MADNGLRPSDKTGQSDELNISVLAQKWPLDLAVWLWGGCDYECLHGVVKVYINYLYSLVT